MKLRSVALGIAVSIGLAAALATGASAQNSLFAVLSGAFVCNKPLNADPPLCRLGDTNGAGTAAIMIFGPTSLCATIMVHNVSAPTAAHLHIGEASYSGPVLVRLGIPISNGGGNPGTSMICNTAVPADTIAAIRANPQFYYIDIHGDGFQHGSLRGQLF